MGNILKQLKEYLPLLLALITLISFLISINFKVDVATQKIDQALVLLKEQGDTVMNNTNRITFLEAVMGVR